MNEINDYKRQGLTITQISALTGHSRPTIRKYLAQPTPPRYGPRQPRKTLLDAYRPFLEARLSAGVWNAVVLHRELKEQGYTGCYTAVKDFVRPLRRQAYSVAVRRFETPPGLQAQVDWGDLGDITYEDGTRQKLNGFVLTLGYSRAMYFDIATDQKLPSFLRLHEAAFAYLGGVPEEILYDNTKTVVVKTLTEGVDTRGEVKLNPTFADFARYWGFTPRLCRPYRPQTKGKVENGIGYVRKNFLCARDAPSVGDLSSQAHHWTAQVANVRVHGTTHRRVDQAWEEEKPSLQPLALRRTYPLVVECVRRVSRDAFVCWRSNRYSVPWRHVGQEVRVREVGQVVEVLHGPTQIAVHALCQQRHQCLVLAAHHQDIPTSDPYRGKARLSLKASAPQVAVRSLSEYEALVSLEGAA